MKQPSCLKLILFFTAAILLGTISAQAGEFEGELLELINNYRISQELPPLRGSAILERLAAEHSLYMKRGRQLSHDRFNQRFESATKYGATTCVENVGWNYATAEGQFEGWQKSAGHDANMLNPDINEVGLARVGPYVTMFACFKP